MWCQQCQPCSFHLCPRCCRHLSMALLWASSLAVQTCSQVWNRDVGMESRRFEKYCLQSTHAMWWLGSAMVSAPHAAELPVGGTVLSSSTALVLNPGLGTCQPPPCSVALRLLLWSGWRQAACLQGSLQSSYSRQQPLVVKSKTKLIQVFLFFIYVFAPPPPFPHVGPKLSMLPNFRHHQSLTGLPLCLPATCPSVGISVFQAFLSCNTL